MADMPHGYFQLYDKQGGALNDKIDLETVGREGVLHGTAHIWVWRRTDEDGLEVLLQERSGIMLTFPGRLDTSAAGHCDYGDKPIDTALRELEEELGIAASPSQLEWVGVHRFHQHVSDEPRIIENEFRWIYLYESDDVKNFTLQKSEITSVKWCPIAEFKQLIKSPHEANVVPHGSDYYGMVVAALEAKLTGER